MDTNVASPEAVSVDDLLRQCRRAAYIKLGKGNHAAERCFAEDALYIGYETGEETLPLLNSEASDRWEQLREQVLARNPDANGASVNAALNQMRHVVDDDGATLWFTFHGTKFWWTFVDTSVPTEPWGEDGKGGRRRTHGWRCTNLLGETIHTADVTTRISQVQGYMRTLRVYPEADRDGFEPLQYLLNLLRGLRQPAAVEADRARAALTDSCRTLIRHLTDREFENFVDLIFVEDGWLRRSEVGGQQRDIDGEYLHATTGLIAKVQVKSSTSSQVVLDSGLLDAGGPDILLYWVFHTERDDVVAGLSAAWGAPERRGGVPWFSTAVGEERRTLLTLGIAELADLAVRKGLTNWLVQKAG